MKLYGRLSGGDVQTVDLKRWLRLNRMTQAQFAKQLGVDATTVGLWIAGRYAPRRRTMAMIIDATQGKVRVTDFAPRQRRRRSE